MASISVRPSADNHDVWSYVGGTVFTDVANVYIGYIGTYKMAAGIFFGGINIAKDSTINTAVLSAAGGVTGSAPPTDQVQVYADDVDDAAVWDTSTSRPSAVIKTTAKSTLITSTLDTNVKTQIEELTVRGGWSTGNDVRFGFFLTGTGWDANEYVYLNAYNSASRATLDVDFTEPAGAGIVLFRRRMEAT